MARSSSQGKKKVLSRTYRLHRAVITFDFTLSLRVKRTTVNLVNVIGFQEVLQGVGDESLHNFTILIGIKLSNKGKIRENSCTTNIQTEDALDVFYQHK